MGKGLNTAVLLMTFLNASILAQTGKPVKEGSISVDYAPPPSDVAGMTAAADAVVIAEYVGQGRQVERVGFVWTFYKFRVIEIVKLQSQLPSVGGELELELVGGDQEHPTSIRRTRDDETRELKRNGRYLLFIGWNVKQAKLQFAWGPAGIYDLTDGRVTSLRKTWSTHDGKDAALFLKEVRSIKRP